MNIGITLKNIAAGTTTDSELGRFALTVFFIAFVIGANMLAQRHLLHGRGTLAQRRSWAAWTKNFFWVVGILLVGGIWATKIAGFALSVAALAAAILVVSKELIGCLLGTAYLALTRPFSIGDYIELGPITGQVLSRNPFSITLLQSADAHQITGRTVTVPSAMLLTSAIVNLSATGAYGIFLTRIHVPDTLNLTQQEELLLAAAQEICAPWKAEADKLFDTTERIEHMDLPSAEPKVLFDFADPKNASLVLRFACEPRLRVRTEQAILKRYLELRKAKPVRRKVCSPKSLSE